MSSPREFIKNNTFGLVLFVVFILLIITRIFADWLWFDSLGYLTVLQTVLFTKIGLGVGVGVLFFLLFVFQLLLVKRYAKTKIQSAQLSIITIVSFIIGLVASSLWEVFLRFNHYVAFGTSDPIFNWDIAFYVFIVPFVKAVLSAVIVFVALSILLVAATSILQKKTVKRVEKIKVNEGDETGYSLNQVNLSLPEGAKLHIAVLAALGLFALAGFFFLKRYDILFSANGAVYGAGFTDITITAPLFAVLAGLAAIVGCIALLYPYTKNFRLLYRSISVFMFIYVIGIVLTIGVQALYVEPNEFNLEEPYIKYNIDFTNEAYGLSDVIARDFEVADNLTVDQLEREGATIENVRIWDWRPLLTTYRQIQLFRTYYEFTDVDVDRYMIDGQLTQVMVSPRELDVNQLDQKAQTWVNKHLVYTHGYGAVVSPVNRFTTQGLPDLLVQNIPPETNTPELEITQPEIYFGEESNDFVVLNTDSREFDYPLGSENVFTDNEGQAGVELSNMIRKFAFAVRLSSLNLFISSAIDSESKIIINRNIEKRVNALAPFLSLDPDSYIVIADGGLHWIIDAYTTTNKYPYSESIGSFNYVRNSVKIVVNSYTGAVDFYVIDPTDPIIQNYQQIFPDLLKPFDSMPASLAEHIRYPEQLLQIQNYIYGTYHMKDPQVFYNKEDAWERPNEVYRNSEVEMEPYYLIMKLPGSDKEGFYLISPFVPRGKENLIAWFAAHSDPDSYGTLELFRLSKQELTYGPLQVEARINQNTEISQLFTLWNQQGSEVIRGNLLIIPIEQSFLYIEPVYLKASTSGALPELKRIIVAYGDAVVMEESLEDALNVIFAGERGAVRIQRFAESDDVTEDFPTTSDEVLAAARDVYAAAQDALAAGDFAEYGAQIEQLGALLE